MRQYVRLCDCGCEQPTDVASRSRTSRGHVSGQPMPRRRGHGFKESPEDRFAARVVKTDTCWLWTGKQHPEGYGVLRYMGEDTLAHRYSYMTHVGPIPDGLHIDHLCRVRSCVNPEHMEPVTCAENVRRGMAPTIVASRTQTCKRGHVGQYVTYPNGARRCHPCLQAWRKSDERVRGQDFVPSESLRTLGGGRNA